MRARVYIYIYIISVFLSKRNGHDDRRFFFLSGSIRIARSILRSIAAGIRRLFINAEERFTRIIETSNTGQYDL